MYHCLTDFTDGSYCQLSIDFHEFCIYGNKNATIRLKYGVGVKSPNDEIIENCVKHEASYCKYRF